MTLEGIDARRAFGRAIVVVAFLLLAVSARLWSAPFFGEDAMVVSWLKTGGLSEAAADLTRPQYGLSSVRFYRPIVSLSLAAQAAVSTEPAWLRTANLAVFLVGIGGLCWIAVRQGASAGGVLVVGLWMCFFPGGPGDWCWIVGRVDAFSFGFGMLGLALLFPLTGVPRLGRGLTAGVLFLVAFLSKETALALGPASAALVLLTAGRAALPAVLAANAGLVAGIVLRLFALDFAAGGYVGAPSPRQLLWDNGSLTALTNLGSVVFGYPRFAAAALVVTPFCGFLWFRRRQGLARPIAVALAAAFTLGPVVAGLRLDPAEASQSRVFPMFFALSGLAWILAIEAAIPRRGVRVLCSAVLLTFPCVATIRNLDLYKGAAARIEEDRQVLDHFSSARGNTQILLGSGNTPPILFAQAVQGWPESDPLVLLYNLGLDERFSPPIGTLGTPVWPFRPAMGKLSGAPFRISRREPGVISVNDPPHPGTEFTDEPPAEILPVNVSEFPSRLTGGDAYAIQRGEVMPQLLLPVGPPGTHLRVLLLTPVGIAWTAALTLPLDWKQLLTAPVEGSSTPLFYILGFAADFRARHVVFRFEWVTSMGVALARTRDWKVELDPTFADYIRETVADPAFGVGRHAPSGVPK